MDSQPTIPSYYAILIGINAYPDKPLESCVRDVEKIKACLESKLLSVGNLDVQTLTASSGNPPPEQLESWPTCHNVTSALEMVTSRAQSGDFVYIHYSGHGTRSPPCYDFSSHSTGDLALVLLDDKDSSLIRLLPAPRLAGLLNSMVDKALVITLVLDCCFSASVYRNDDPSIRYLPYSRVGTLTYPQTPEHNLIGGNTYSASRDASMRDNWLLDPDRYAILAACGPHETAKGGSEKIEGGECYGALSYFLFEALSDHGLGRRHKDLYRHLCAKFWESCQVQHPVLYGNKEQAFFGPTDPYHTTRSTIPFERDGSLRLLAGLAHGLHVGDRFTLFPLGSPNDRDAEKNFIAKVTHLWPLTCELKPLSTPHSSQTGWIAEPLTCSYLLDFPVRLASELSHQDEWRAALEERSLSICIDDEQNPVFQVVLSNNEYEILDEDGRKIINLSAIPRDQMDANRVCHILEHLVRFRMAKDITNETPGATFRESLNIQIRANGEAFNPGQQIEVQHGDVVTLDIENAGKTTLYVHMYNLGPLWRIKEISCEVIPKRDYDYNYDYNYDPKFTGISSKKIKMTVPSVMNGYGSCEDIIKVFVTSQSTSFDSLELPNLNELDKTNVGDRADRPSNHEPEDWVALNFPIRTLL
ncbi:MAG: hypothetical protein M1822_008863 [Bathelium mastoideum]|nr:MAG: hypothetical protein M1822_008863 [Bathelium mastoideum]